MTIYERQTYPLLWAHSTGNLGLNWTELSVNENCTDPLRDQKKAEDCFLAALEILTLEREPFHHARVLANMATLYEKMLNIPSAEHRDALRTKTVGHLRAAQELFHDLGAEQFSQTASEALERLSS